MREPPQHVADADVLALVRAHWVTDVDAVEHLAVGFGAHHWMASTSGAPRLFVTFDGLGQRHTAPSLEAAYAAAAELAAGGLEFVVASLPNRHGDYTAALAHGMVSCTPWLVGEVAGPGPLGSAQLAQANGAALSRLHAATAPARISRWRPVVEVTFGEDIEVKVRDRWTGGPYGERARSALARHTGSIHRWTAAYHRLARLASERVWVPTHGEPHSANQLVTAQSVVFVDWESLKLAPRERDLRPLIDAGCADLVAPDWPMVEMFDLEWRLDELSEYSSWFSRPHDGTASDRVAIAGLIEELERPEWQRPG